MSLEQLVYTTVADEISCAVYQTMHDVVNGTVSINARLTLEQKIGDVASDAISDMADALRDTINYPV